MNYHQTKGREADVVIHVFHDDDYFGNEAEPFEELSAYLMSRSLAPESG